MKDILFDNPFFYNNVLTFLTVVGYMSKVFLFFFIISVLYVDYTTHVKEIFLKVTFYVKFVVALLLVYRFNSYRTAKIQFTNLDRKMAYSAGLFILLLAFADAIVYYSTKIHTIAYPYSSYVVNFIYSSIWDDRDRVF